MLTSSVLRALISCWSIDLHPQTFCSVLVELRASRFIHILQWVWWCHACFCLWPTFVKKKMLLAVYRDRQEMILLLFDILTEIEEHCTCRWSHVIVIEHEKWKETLREIYNVSTSVRHLLSSNESKTNCTTVHMGRPCYGAVCTTMFILLKTELAVNAFTLM